MADCPRLRRGCCRGAPGAERAQAIARRGASRVPGGRWTGDEPLRGKLVRHRRPRWKRERATITMKKATTAMTKSGGAKEGKGGGSPSALIDARIKELSDWRGEMLARVRTLIKQADPDVVEEWKWRGVPVWEHAGIICTGETYKAVVKLTFAKGASLADPSGLFNSS